jgi:transcriptional regulator with XRE-family HTH domain
MLARTKAIADGSDSSKLAELDRDINLSMALAQLVYDRRTELGLSQEELAQRCGLTQAKISRIEGSDTVPTLALLAKLAKGLNAALNIAVDVEDTSLTLTAHRAA